MTVLLYDRVNWVPMYHIWPILGVSEGEKEKRITWRNITEVTSGGNRGFMRSESGRIRSPPYLYAELSPTWAAKAYRNATYP